MIVPVTGRTLKPDRETIGYYAEHSPAMLNALVAYFVFEWRNVTVGATGQHGEDQAGIARRVPDYVSMHGTDWCVHVLLRAPEERRGLRAPGFVSNWLEKLATDTPSE